MWDQQLFEFIISTIPQSFALILLFFALVGIKIEIKSFSLYSVGISFIPLLLRPYVSFGIHSVITMFALVLIAVIWAKAKPIPSILFAVISFGVAYVTEWLTFVSLEIGNFDMSLLDTNVQIRTVIGFIPLTALFAVGLAVYYIKKNVNKKKENKDVTVWENF